MAASTFICQPILLLPFFVFVQMCVFMCVCVLACSCLCLCGWTSVWRPEDSLRRHSQAYHPPPLASLTGLEWLAGHPLSCQHWGYKCAPLCPGLTWILGLNSGVRVFEASIFTTEPSLSPRSRFNVRSHWVTTFTWVGILPLCCAELSAHPQLTGQ